MRKHFAEYLILTKFCKFVKMYDRTYKIFEFSALNTMTMCHNGIKIWLAHYVINKEYIYCNNFHMRKLFIF